MLAVFDLDGTITRHDTLFQYLCGFLRRHPLRLLRVPPALAAVARFLLGRADRGELKSAWIRALIGGTSRGQIEAWTQRFLSRLIAKGIRTKARAAIERHRSAGDTLVLLTASPDLYVPSVADALGFAESVCTEVAWQGDRLDGRLITPNRRGPEKARCLQELRQRHPHLPLIAYGNASSDLEHLVLADSAVLVNGSPRARRAAARCGIECVTWP